MREKIIGKNLSFVAQKKLAQERDVLPSDLLRRMLFNFLEHVRSGEKNAYPDAQGLDLVARTSTVILDPGDGTEWPLGCGGASFYTLCCYNRSCAAAPEVGLAVVLPTKV